MNSTPFGGSARTEVLVALQLLDESYARELARLLGRSQTGVQKAVQGLEREGLIAARPAGRTRMYRLNPRYFARTELAQYLARLAEPERDLQQRIAAIRRRPRRSGKPL
jgi:predicted transcriptional regulator